jgi:hypothetical protein
VWVTELRQVEEAVSKNSNGAPAGAERIVGGHAGARQTICDKVACTLWKRYKQSSGDVVTGLAVALNLDRHKRAAF